MAKNEMKEKRKRKEDGEKGLEERKENGRNFRQEMSMSMNMNMNMNNMKKICEGMNTP